VPYYLNAHHWWAYIHPRAVQLFERQWLVNLILWGNYARLRDAVLDEMGDSLPGRTLQVACVYGDLTARLGARVAEGGRMDVVDVPGRKDHRRGLCAAALVASLRYIWRPLLARLEPFALDLWRDEIAKWLRVWEPVACARQRSSAASTRKW
jgi:hypothetical protein